MSNRREFLAHAAAATGLLWDAVAARGQDNRTAASKPLRLLILGGTGFIGPHHVRAAVARGHKVAVFNRGKSVVDLPPEVERLVGDRNDNLDAIKNRDWDAVLDLAVYIPAWVRSLGEGLKGRVKHYTYISTEAVYPDPKPGETITEGSQVLVYRGDADPYALNIPDKDYDYGAFKVLCEQEAKRQFPGKTLILRPTYIVGPGDPQGYFGYWLVRLGQGGEILVADSPSIPVQFIDIRDMADWAVRMIEKGATGTYNTAGPAAPMTLGQMIESAGKIVSVSPKLTWVPSSFLTTREDKLHWGKVIYWSLADFGGRMRLSTTKAIAAGLTMRPVGITMSDTLAWYKKEPAEQAEMLHLAKMLTMPWPTYLEQEKKVLAEWHAQQQ